MMVVRIQKGIVVEKIPDYALPVEKWYGEKFAKQCVDAPDEVEQGWRYADGVFTKPNESIPESEATIEEILNALLGVTA
jgi:hypothetical protein